MASGMRSSVKSKYETYRKILEKKAEEVRSSMSAQKAAQVLAREEHPHDEGDLSQQSHEEWIFLNRNTLDIKLLREVQDALRRIEQGSYGVCYECEEPISAKRLDAVPSRPWSSRRPPAESAARPLCVARGKRQPHSRAVAHCSAPLAPASPIRGATRSSPECPARAPSPCPTTPTD